MIIFFIATICTCACGIMFTAIKYPSNKVLNHGLKAIMAAYLFGYISSLYGGIL